MIFLVGQHCAGKSRVSVIFSQARFLRIDLGPLLREIHQRTSPRISFADWISAGEEAEGKRFTDLQLAREVSRQVGNASGEHWQDLVIVGNRSLEGVKYLAERIGPYEGRKNVIIWVEAPIATLYTRYGLRNPDYQLSYPDFLSLLEDDNKLGLSALKGAADLELRNTGSEYELETRVLALIKQLGYA